MAAQIGEQISAVLPVTGVHEDRPQIVADLSLDPRQRVILRAVGGEFEGNVGALAVLRAEGMQTGEMRAVLAVLKLVERSFDKGLCRISQSVDGGFGVRDTIQIERRDDGDESVAHGDHRSNRKGRWAGNGPAHSMVPTDLIPRRTSAPTSAGI